MRPIVHCRWFPALKCVIKHSSQRLFQCFLLYGEALVSQALYKGFSGSRYSHNNCSNSCCRGHFALTHRHTRTQNHLLSQIHTHARPHTRTPATTYTHTFIHTRTHTRTPATDSPRYSIWRGLRTATVECLPIDCVSKLWLPNERVWTLWVTTATPRRRDDREWRFLATGDDLYRCDDRHLKWFWDFYRLLCKVSPILTWKIYVLKVLAVFHSRSKFSPKGQRIWTQYSLDAKCNEFSTETQSLCRASCDMEFFSLTGVEGSVSAYPKTGKEPASRLQIRAFI